MGNQTYQNSPCPSATMASRVCSHHGRLRRMPRANPTTVAAVVKHIHYTGMKNLRERHREKEGPLSLRKNCALTVLRTLKTQRTPVLVQMPVEGCGAFHHSLLHPTQLHISASEKKGSVDSASAVSTTACTTACTTTGTEDPGTILLQVVPLRVMGADGLVVTNYAMLDSGSEITLVDPSLVSSLRLSDQPDRLVLSTVNSQEPQEGERVDLVVEVFIPLEVRCGNPGDPIAIRSCLGFAVLGRTGDSSAQQCYDVHYIHTATDDISLNYQVERFWELESFGSTKPYTSMSVEDKCAEQIIHSTISKANNHYCMDLLWKNDQPSLPFNRAMAKIRLHHLKQRLERDKDLHEKYSSAISSYVTKGHARKLTKEEAERRTNKTWYLPHHPVISPNKPGKVRVVFDAAAKFHGTSLNDQLLQGPDYINNLAGVLMRFRQEEVVLVADIEQMFHQVRVPAEDCDALRFLWWSGDLNDEPAEYQMLVHIFGATSSPCCSNKALRQTADDNEDKYGSEAAETVRRNFYVDDLLKSVQTTDQATALAVKLTAMLKEGGFHLTKFLSNRREVLSALPTQERANPTLNLELDQLPINRTLGLHWEAERDVFCFKTVSTNKPATKRGILSTISSLFDPLGFLSPFILPIKVLIQDLWKGRVEWDDEIQGHHLKVWRQWTGSLPRLEDIKIPRCYRNPDISNSCTVQLHVFSDASEYAYSAGAYLRLSDDHRDQAHC